MGFYDIAQVCTNGHVVNDLAKEMREQNKEFCEKCGKKTITKCSSCNAEIQGRYNNGQQFERPVDIPPAFCQSCGKPYPWTDIKIKVAHEFTQELEDITKEDKAILSQSIDDIVTETPRTNLAVVRIKKILTKITGVAYTESKKIIVDIASETAKKLLLGE